MRNQSEAVLGHHFEERSSDLADDGLDGSPTPDEIRRDRNTDLLLRAFKLCLERQRNAPTARAVGTRARAAKS